MRKFFANHGIRWASLILCFSLTLFAGCHASEPAVKLPQKSDPDSASSDAVLSETTRSEDQNVTVIRLYYINQQDRSGIFQRINQMLKSKGYPYQVDAVNYYKEVMSGYVRQQILHSIDYFEKNQPELKAKFEAEGFDYIQNEFQRLDHYGLFKDREWKGVEETRLYLEACQAQDEPIDLIMLEKGHTYTPVSEPVTAFIQHDLIANLDHLMETPAGQKLKSSYPETVWQTLLTDGRQYLLPGSMVLELSTTADYWINRPLAEQYGIDIRNWGEDIWNHQDELEQVWRGEQSSQSFGLFSENFGIGELKPYLTKWMFVDSSIVFNEDSCQFQSYYTLDAVQKLASFYRDCVNAGYATEPGQTVATPTHVFLSDLQPNHLPAAEDYAPIGERAACFYDCFWNQFAIAGWSRQPEAAFELFCLLYTDPELNKLLIEANGQAERHPISGELSSVLGNPFLYEGNLEAAEARLAAQPKSGLYGRTFDLSDYTEELNAFFDFRLYNNLHSRDQMGGAGYDPVRWAAELDQLGLGRILEELNRQLTEGAESGPAADGG